jgi:hypothetical protein
MQSGESTTRAQRFAWLLVPLIALMAVHPLLVHGCSCGHDFEFHLESWLDAAQQMRHGTLYPQWAFTAAWNAGEPRFLFYPPLSWMLGALLTMVLPLNAAPIVFTWLALSGAGLSMFFLARRFASTPAALLASAIYLANPYLLFTGFERTAYAELLAAAWMPLVVMAALNARARLASIAIPIALLWLTNAPAAVIGSYGFALIVALSLAMQWWRTRAELDHAKALARRALHAGAGAITGILLVGFYLVPAAYEQRWVQIAMATLPNMRVEDSFLFGHTTDAGHNMVLHTASVIGVVLLAATVLALGAAWRRSTSLDTLAGREKNVAVEERGFRSSGVSEVVGLWGLIALLAVTTATVLFLLTPPSLFLWHLLPKLAFLQFPWRLLSLEGVVLALAVALGLPQRKLTLRWAALLGILFALSMSAMANHLFRQSCDTGDLPSARAALLASHHGMPPTDEYTPRTADNDALRATDPSSWITDDPNAPAPGTQPYPGASDPNFDPSDLDDTQTLSSTAPGHNRSHLLKPHFLILNLRDYPAWDVTLTVPGQALPQHPAHLQRDDGLLAVALPAGDSIVDIRWHPTPDHEAGLGLSALGLAILGLAAGLSTWRSRRGKVA